MRTLTLALVLAGAVAAPAAAQDFNWHGRIPAGQTIEIIGINGAIHATPGSGEAQVTATKSGRGDHDAVKIQTVQHAGGVTICAVYPAPAGKPANECKPGGGRSNTRDAKVDVDFEVHVPAGVRLVARTVNGKVAAENLAADIDATTVNGGITASSTGLVRARTVNGSIEARMGQAAWSGELELATVNGSVHVTLPASASTEVEAGTVNGSLSTDFPLTVQGRFLRNRINGTIGQGGRQLKINTVNGSIQISKA